MLYCFDTNIVIELFHQNESIIAKMKEVEQQQVSVTLTPVTICELFKGAYLSQKQQESLQIIHEFINNLKLLSFTIEAAKIYGQNYAELKAKGKPTQEFDLMIASMCIAHNAVLVTRNAKDFAHIKELKVVQW